MKILAVTACPTGIAHTYMAAEAIEDAAKKMGYEVKVETRGSVGVENELTDAEIKEADAIILACDTAVPMERFAGKKVLSISVSEALKSTDKLIERALNASVYAAADLSDAVASIKEQRAAQRTGVYKHLMNGVSFMIPFVVAGGIAIALSFIFGYNAFGTGTLAAGAGSSIMAAVMAAGMVPPLGLALATVLFKNKFTVAEKEAGKAAWVLGASFITEGAIPFAAADPLRVIPSIMIGSAITGALSMAFNATLSVPHGGIFVFFAVENWPLYILAIAIGTVVTGLIIGTIKKKVEE